MSEVKRWKATTLMRDGEALCASSHPDGAYFEVVLASDYDRDLAEVEALDKRLRDLLDDMAEDVSQRHHRDKYRAYQVAPEVVEEARAFLAAREKTT